MAPPGTRAERGRTRAAARTVRRDRNLQAAIGAYYDFESPNVNIPCMSFVEDVTIGEGESVPPDTQFTKTWRVQNTGSEAWPPGVCLRYVGGDQFGHVNMVLVRSLDTQEMTDVSVPMCSPNQPGMYQGQWRMCTATGLYFGVKEGVNSSPVIHCYIHQLGAQSPPVSPRRYNAGEKRGSICKDLKNPHSNIWDSSRYNYTKFPTPEYTPTQSRSPSRTHLQTRRRSWSLHQTWSHSWSLHQTRSHSRIHQQRRSTSRSHLQSLPPHFMSSEQVCLTPLKVMPEDSGGTSARLYLTRRNTQTKYQH
ncbi:protein ILRUN [Anomaloglossus baeobatrachus]|uniref:protein ILRUN n=1 Tax=Anomaloglossus baeobatrachus TaxID=238106 RepID=UPI003F4F6D86